MVRILIHDMEIQSLEAAVNQTASAIVHIAMKRTKEAQKMAFLDPLACEQSITIAKINDTIQIKLIGKLYVNHIKQK